MSFDLRGVKPDDVIGLFSRGEPPIPNYVPRHAAQKSGTDSPPCRIYFKRPGSGHVNLSDTNSPIRFCRAGGTLGTGLIRGRGSPGYPSRAGASTRP